MVERTLSVYRGGKLHCCLLIFRLLPLQSQPTNEPFSFACKAVSPMGVIANVPNSSCLEHLRFSYVYGFALFPFSWLSSILGFTEFSWKFGETALWCHRAAREIGRTFMWVFATTPHAGWHTCGEDFSFRVGLLSFFAKMDFLPISTYFESQATPLSKPHGHAILLTSVPSSTLLYL